MTYIRFYGNINSKGDYMQFTVMTDPHVQIKNLDKVGELFEIIEELGNNVFCLGDLFNTKQIISAPASSLRTPDSLYK